MKTNSKKESMISKKEYHKNNKDANKFKSHDPQKTIELIITLNKTKKTSRWAYGDNFVKAYMNIKATKKCLEDEMLGDLINDRLSPGPEPTKPDYLDFQKKNILIKPHEFDENETSIEWLTIFIPEYNEYNIDTLPSGLRNSASIAIRSLRSETRTELKKYLMNERRRIEKLTTDFQEKASKLETKFDQKMSQYNRDKDTWDSKVRYWREMSTKFMSVINTYWVNEISVMVQRQAINDGYTIYIYNRYEQFRRKYISNELR